MGLKTLLVRQVNSHTPVGDELQETMTNLILGNQEIVNIIETKVNSIQNLSTQAFIIVFKDQDDNKTRITEENGEAEELYITVDGKEYHL